MGTSFTCGATKRDIVNEILLSVVDRLVESHQTTEDRESVLWTVEKGERDGEPFQFIGCYVLRQAGGDWGYKAMDETVGPNFVSVPKVWLDKYPCIIPGNMRGYSDKWRAEIRG